MGRYPQPSNGHGSLRDTQILINMFSTLLFREINQAISIKSKEIQWVSPKQDDEFAEYRDEAFMRKIGTETLVYPLNNFWPKKVPQWDALVNIKKSFSLRLKLMFLRLSRPGLYPEAHQEI
jgi:hypothetical protein